MTEREKNKTLKTKQLDHPIDNTIKLKTKDQTQEDQRHLTVMSSERNEIQE